MKKVWLSMRLRYERRVNWIRNNIVLRKRLLFIWGLVVCHSIVEYPVVCNLLMLYLVKFVGQRTVVAAITINLLHSFSSLFVFLAAYIAEVFTNRFNVIVFSTGSYTTGLILLWISAKSRREFNMFYLAIILIAIVFLFCLRRTTQRRIPLMRIGAGMVFAVFSCVAARQVELHRQHSIGPISIFWLVPQYILLGLMEGFAGGGLVTFFYDHLPKSMKSFAEAFSELILCIGKISSIFFLLIINAWFDHHIKDNRFDRYFLILAILCSLFFCLYLACSLGYDNLETTAEIEESYAMEAGVEDGDQEEEESPEDMDISVEEFGDAGYEIRGNIRW
ncbi:hypothetical protein L6164_002223 [Bauhinia variegata]|uniref:Uncharacterized protein n=1 Tax=Bauhinia variegata TaxID=167791 RepID=A0ACB9PX00_BAUVA|nr:hypothetical protein L6164_002223 [Bauhinia variegata]